MKKVLLTTTAVALTAGMVSAGDMSMSGSISLTYGGFGTGSAPAAAKEDFSSEADLNIAASSSSGSISMSGTLEIDEEYDEDALLKANDWHQRLGSFLALVDKTLTTGVQFKDLRINIVEIEKES